MTQDFTINHSLKKKWTAAGIAATLVIVFIIPLSFFRYDPNLHTTPDLGKETSKGFVGSLACMECHKNEYDRWKGSYHDRAMDEATDETVLGNFDNARFTHGGLTTRFFKKQGKFYVHTQGPDGTFDDFQVTHTFGFYPLQQYLIPFDGGKFQCLSIAWDEIKKRWYALPNYTDDPSDWLHWTNQSQNWNGMCAECHSTNLKKGYDPDTGDYNTTWSQINVGCEACHGPGADHADWARIPEMGRPNLADAGLKVKTRQIDSPAMMQICARCHSRRAFIDDFSHQSIDLMDYMIPSLLEHGLYYPDGQILDEVFVSGSFMQSKMFARGIKCSDCHDIHSLKLKEQGNELCLTCHKKALYDTRAHHFHKKIHGGKESRGDDCVACHMPESPYMGIDYRADHSLRIPRPDLSQPLSTPNSCSAAGCHADKSLAWANDAVTKWYGLRKRPHYGQTFADARQGNPDVLAQLVALSKDVLYPGIVRATALSLLSSYPDQQSYAALERALSDPSPLIRQTAISTINLLAFDKDAALIFPLLYDPVKAVRIQAALGVATLKGLKLTPEQKKVFQAGVEEYITAMEYSADFPSGRYNLGLIYQALGKTDKAVESYLRSIAIDDLFIPAKNNLAMLYNARKENEKAEQLLKQILEARPGMHDIAYSLGLLLVEEKKYDQALHTLERAAKGLPQRSRVHYNLGLLYQYLKNAPKAERSLIYALSLEPENPDFLLALAHHYIATRAWDKAKQKALTLIQLFPKAAVGYDMINHIDAMKNKK